MSRLFEDTRVQGRKKKVSCIYERADGRFEGMYLAGWGEDGKLQHSYFTAGDEEEAVRLLDKYEKVSPQRRKELPSEEQEEISRGHDSILIEDEMRRLTYMAKYNLYSETLGLMFALFMGISAGELCALSWDDFDIKRGEVTIRHIITPDIKNTEDMLMKVKSSDGEEWITPRSTSKSDRTRIAKLRSRKVRTEQYPMALDSYVKALYTPGTFFLTGKRDIYIDQIAYSSRLKKYLAIYGLSGFQIRHAVKTFREMLSDQGMLERVFTNCPNRLVDDLVEERRAIWERSGESEEEPTKESEERSVEESTEQEESRLVDQSEDSANKEPKKEPELSESVKKRNTLQVEPLSFTKKSHTIAKGGFENKEAVDERWLMKEMVFDLPALRKLIGISAAELGSVMDLNEEQYREVEEGELPMDWSMFLSFLFFFSCNSKTTGVVEALGLYPRALRKKLLVVKRER